MTQPQTTSPLLSGIDRALALVEAQIKQLEMTSPVTKGTIRGEAGTEAYHLDDLEVFAERLKQIKAWLQGDPDLLVVVDNHIGQQARLIDQRKARRDRRLALVTTIGGAILGWLLSEAATPAQFIHLIVH